MSDQEYEAQTIGIEGFAEQLKMLTPEQIKAIREARIKAGDQEWSEAYQAALWAAWGEKEGFGVWYGARDAILALIARDSITPDQFDTLYGPWASVMEEK
jgi:hypothetical protein